MKKAIFTVLAVLVIISCEFTPGNEPASLSLNIAGSEARALTGDIAVAATGYYEVSFKKNGPNGGIVRTSWDYSRTGRIQITPGTYTVVLFAGRNSDKTLLGVGRPSEVTDRSVWDSSSSTRLPITDFEVEITSSTVAITFTVHPLVNNINDKNDFEATDNSTFNVFRNTPPAFNEFPAPSNLLGVSLENDIPVFLLNPAGTSSYATWRIGIGNSDMFVDGSTIELASDNFIGKFAEYILLADEPKITYDIHPSSYTQILTSAEFIGLNTHVKINDNGIFEMELVHPDEKGTVQISIDIPVFAFGPSDLPIKWYIRGGLNNGLIDEGIKSVGGAIVLSNIDD